MHRLLYWIFCASLSFFPVFGYVETAKTETVSSPQRKKENQETLSHSEAEWALSQARKLYNQGKYRESLAQYTVVLEFFRTEHHVQREADVISDIAVVYRKLGELDRSLELQQQAARMYAELGYVPGQAKALRRIGVLYRHRGKLFQAISYQEDALELLKQENDQEGIARMLSNLGIVYGELGRLQDAQQYFGQALDIHSQLQNQEGVSYTLGNLGQLFLYLGNSSQALEYLEQSLTIKRQLGDVRGEANTLLNTGTAHKNLGDFQKALTFYYKSLELYKQLNEQKGKAAALGSIGSTYEELGDLKRAQQYQLESLHIKKISGTPVQISIALTNLASLAIKQQRFSEADTYLQEALKIAIAHDSILAQANIYGQRGLSHLYQDKFSKSLEDFSRSLGLYENIGSQKGVLEALDYTGQAYIRQKAFQEAFPYYERALQLASELNDMNSLWTVQYRLGQIALNSGDDDLAAEYFTSSITTLEQMRSYLKVPELRQLFMRKNLNPYSEMIRLLLKKKKNEEALLYLERFKARTFLEVVAHGEPQLHTVPALIQEEQYLAARIRFLSERLSSSFVRNRFAVSQQQITKAFDDIERELHQAKEQYEQLLLRIKLQYPDYYRLKIVDADEIQRLIDKAVNLLDENVVILEYFLDAAVTHVWIIEQHQIHYVSLSISHSAVLDNVLRFRGKIRNYDSTEIFTPLRELYTWLVEPVEPYLAGKTIVGIVPYQILHFVPFSTLIRSPLPESLQEEDEEVMRPAYFIDEYAIFSLPSLSMLPVVREGTRRNSEKAVANPQRYFLGIGNATDDLPGAKEEIRTVLKYFRNSRGYTGAEATKQRLFDEAGSYDIIHLATHGVFDKQYPMFSHLEFSSGSYLYAREIFGLQLWSTLVTLSGCETLLPQHVDVEDLHALVSGDELVGFIRAFMYAGTPSVLASLWWVSDIATQHLMSAFYQNLPKLGKARALQLASQTVIQSTLHIGRRKKRELPLFHPFFWSSFVLIGDWK